MPGVTPLQRSPSEGRVGATSSVSVLSPHTAAAVSRWGQVQSVLQPLSSRVDRGDTCSVLLSPKPAVSVAPNLPGRQALCEVHTCCLRRGFRGTE